MQADGGEKNILLLELKPSVAANKKSLLCPPLSFLTTTGNSGTPSEFSVCYFPVLLLWGLAPRFTIVGNKDRFSKNNFQNVNGFKS